MEVDDPLAGDDDVDDDDSDDLGDNKGEVNKYGRP